ncbi:AHH domain-containing protein [Flectobacillus major]|uniref:AHH domain-containing protein n=1 Tax=Flectobacillus major TaxID=103 RepID=UPI00047BBF83|nr:AHH domain-containing protein [Flectobacillus major]
MKGTKLAVMGTKAISSMAKMKVIKSALVGIAGVRKYNGAITTAKYSQWTKIDGYQIHHIIPQSLMDKPIGRAISKVGFDIDAGDNLRYLQEGFHAKHGAYTKYVRDELQSIIDVNGKLTISDINGVINNMHGLIDKAEAAYKSSGTTLNNFFK